MAEIGDHIVIGDLNLPENLELMNYTEEEMLCSVAAPKMPSEEEDAAADEALAAAEAAEAGEGTEGGEAPEGEATE